MSQGQILFHPCIIKTYISQEEYTYMHINALKIQHQCEKQRLFNIFWKKKRKVKDTTNCSPPEVIPVDMWTSADLCCTQWIWEVMHNNVWSLPKTTTVWPVGHYAAPQEQLDISCYAQKKLKGYRQKTTSPPFFFFLSHLQASFLT